MSKTISICGVDVEIEPGPIGISFSGGADSSLLLYILMMHHPGPIHAFTLALEPKGFGSAQVSENVIQHCMRKLDHYGLMHHVFYSRTPNLDTLFQTQLDYMDRYGLFNALYFGDTASPPKEDMVSWSDTTDETERRDPNTIRPTRYGNFLTPFTNHDKRKISEIYQTLDVRDSLFPLTRSCAAIGINQGHCQRCWWCEERLWAFGTHG